MYGGEWRGAPPPPPPSLTYSSTNVGSLVIYICVDQMCVLIRCLLLSVCLCALVLLGRHTSCHPNSLYTLGTISKQHCRINNKEEEGVWMENKRWAQQADRHRQLKANWLFDFEDWFHPCVSVSVSFFFWVPLFETPTTRTQIKTKMCLPSSNKTFVRRELIDKKNSVQIHHGDTLSLIIPSKAHPDFDPDSKRKKQKKDTKRRRRRRKERRRRTLQWEGKG